MKPVRYLFLMMIVSVLLLLQPSCKKDETPPCCNKQATIIDTDVGIDDAMAILYLLQHPGLDILGITIAGTGMSHMVPATENTLNLLALAGNPDIPVAQGDTNAINSQNPDFRPEMWINLGNTMMDIPLPENPNPPISKSAVNYLIETITSSEQPVRIVVLGPLTNLGMAMQQQPTLTENIESIYIMGGAVNVPGNLPSGGIDDNIHAEWNIFLDPDAAEIVFKSGVEVVLVPLDATNHAPITNEFYNRLKNDRSTPESEFVYDVLTKLNVSVDTIFFWDPLAAVIASDRNLASIQTYPLVVVTGEGIENGRTKIDTGPGSPIEVCENVALSDFENLFLNVLNGRK